MPRSRKVPVKDPPKNKKPQTKPNSKEKPSKKIKLEPKWMQGDGLTVVQLVLSIQKTDCNNAKVIKELKKLYMKMGNDAFVETFIKCIMLFLLRDEQDVFAPRVLKFIGVFVASFGDETDEDGSSHPLIKSVFAEILSISAKLYHVRARICSLVAQIMFSFSQRAELDEQLMDSVVARMIGEFIKDISPLVRVNAINALQRLQDPDNLEDQVTKAYIFHMEADPVSKVRQAVVTAIAKKITTIPYVLERLRDSDEKVRRHTYLQMSSYPVKSYKIRDRIRIISAGLYDRSEMVKKAVNNVLLPNWLAAYDNDFVDYIKAIKLDSSDTELQKFRSLAQDALNVVFSKFKVEHLFDYLKLSTEDEFRNCLPIEKTSVLEWLIVWKVAIKRHQEYVESKQKVDHDDEAVENMFGEESNDSIVMVEIMPELSIFCDFIEKFLNNFKIDSSDADAKLRIMTFNHCLIVLLEIAQMNDLGDEIGRNRLQMLLKKILIENDVSDLAVKEITYVMEVIIPSVELRQKFLNDIVTELLNLSSPTEYNRLAIIEELIGKADSETKLLVSNLKMSMMELKEQERLCVEAKRYAEAHKVSQEFAKKNTELVELLRPFNEESSSSSQEIVDSLSSVIVAKKATPSEVLKSLRICYYTFVSKGVKSMTPEILKTYNSFVRFHLESSDVVTRIWALQTATAYSLLYEPLAKEVYDILKSQLFKSTNYNIWEVTIGCIVDLLLRYSIDKMDRYNEIDPEINPNNSTQNRSKRGGRTLYSDDGDEVEEMDFLSTVPVMQLLMHLVDNTLDLKVHKALTIGLSKLILHGQFVTREIISKFLLAYFNPATDPEINQILGIFFESLIRKKKQEYLEEALVSTLITLLEAPHDSPLHEVKQETVIRYVVEATRPIFCSNGLNLHNTLCLKLIDVMKTNPENKDITKVFSRELLTLEIGDDPLLKKDIIAQIDILLGAITADVKTKKNLSDFRAILQGTYKPPLKFSSTAMSAKIDENDDAGIPEEADDEEVELASETEESNDAEVTMQPERIALGEVLDISASQANVRNFVVNVTKLEYLDDEQETDSNNESKEETLIESSLIEIPPTPPTAEEIEVTRTSIHEDSLPNVQTPKSPETQTEDASIDSSDDEVNETVLEATTIESSVHGAIEATPENLRRSERAKKAFTTKRQLELSVTKNSPMRKNPKNEQSPKPALNKSRLDRSLSTPSSVPNTPKTPKSLAAGSLTPLNNERVTRKTAKDDLAQSLTLTRSASKKMNIDVETVVGVQKASSETSKPTKVVKKTLPAPTKASILRAAKVESETQKKRAVPAGAESLKPTGSKAAVSTRPATRQRDNTSKNVKQRPRWN